MPQRSILVIEDDFSIRETLKMALELEGYEVFTASNGQEGLEQVKRIPQPCLILLDLMMPVMNGFEFLSTREKEVMIAPIPVVIVSAFPDQASQIKAQGFVKKPIDLNLLLDLIHRYCA